MAEQRLLLMPSSKLQVAESRAPCWNYECFDRPAAERRSATVTRGCSLSRRGAPCDVLVSRAHKSHCRLAEIDT